MTLSERCAYVKGLMEGLNLTAETSEGKILHEVVDLLGDVSTAIANLQENAMNVSDELDEIEESIDLLEACVYDEDDEEDPFELDDDDYNYGDAEYEVTCPKCGEVVVVDEDTLLDGEIACPKCGEKLEFEFDADEAD